MNARRKWVRTSLVLATAGVALYGMLRWFEHSQVFQPSRQLVATAAELGRPFEDVFLTTSDGVRLNGWFFPGNTNSLRKDMAILVCHGNAGNISHRLEVADALLSTGVSVLLLDYRGYGRSEGRPSEQGTYLDAQAAYDWLRKKGFAPTKVIAFGESLGGGVAAELAVKAPVGGLILQSTFTSIPDIGAELLPWLPVRWLGRIGYNTRSKLPKIHVPVLVMHSRADELVNFRHARRNYESANDPKLFCEISGGHNDPLANHQQFVGAIEKFLALVKK